MSPSQDQMPEMSMVELKGEENATTTKPTEPQKEQETITDVEDGRDINDESRPKALPKDNPISKPAQSQSMEVSDYVVQLRQQYRKLEKAYDELHVDYKDLKRENREQSLDIRDLRKQNAVLQESKRHNAHVTDNHREQARKDRQELIERLQLQDEHINQLKHELHKRKAHMDSLTMQTREANEEKANLEFMNQKLANQNRALSENLTECKDDLLRLQPPSQKSDSEISEQYSNLHQHISRWVDDETEDSQMLEQRFEALGANVDDLPESLRKYIKSDHLRLARKYPSAQPLILRYLVQSYLNDCIFSDDIFFFGLDLRTTQLLMGIEQGMGRLEPQRDTATIRNWRSETLNAILQMREFSDGQESQAIAISHSMHKTLSYLLPTFEGKEEGWKQLYDQLVTPAIHTAMNIRLSTTNYRIVSPTARSLDQAKIIYINEIQRYELIDIMSQKIIRADSNLKVADDGRIGEQVLVVQQALLRDQKDGSGSVLLCKPTVLVRLDEPMGRRNRGTMRALQSWFKGESGD